MNNFNKQRVINQTIWQNKPEISTGIPGPKTEYKKGLFEPIISNLEKFNTNMGW